MSTIKMVGQRVRVTQQHPNYTETWVGWLEAVDGETGYVARGTIRGQTASKREAVPLTSIVLDETTEEANAAEEGRGGRHHWAEVPSEDGTRLVWRRFDALSSAIRTALTYRDCPALRHGAAPVVHEARKAKGVRVDVYLTLSTGEVAS